MAKRFTDTNKYKKPFIRGLQGAYKLFWDYLYHDCDHAGIWIVDFEIAQLYLGNDMSINKPDAIKYFNEGEIRIIEFDNGKKWFIKSFVEFQYGILNEQNRVHLSVLTELKRHNLNKGLISSLQGAKEKDKEKDKDSFDLEEELKVRALIFKDQIREQKQNYSDEMLKKFYEYWIEPNKSKTKMRFEGEKYFDIPRRLTTWASRDKNFNPETAGYKQTTIPKDVR
jgi:hypothetical protein